MQVSESALNDLMALMDPSGDGQIDFGEFCDVMASGTSDPKADTPAEMARAIFDLMDRDGSGKITASELKAEVKKLNPSVTDEEVSQAMLLFDKDGSNSITEKEFRHGIEIMKTF